MCSRIIIRITHNNLRILASLHDHILLLVLHLVNLFLHIVSTMLLVAVH